jgi:hypothetical protein
LQLLIFVALKQSVLTDKLCSAVASDTVAVRVLVLVTVDADTRSVWVFRDGLMLLDRVTVEADTCSE